MNKDNLRYTFQYLIEKERQRRHTRLMSQSIDGRKTKYKSKQKCSKTKKEKEKLDLKRPTEGMLM